MLDTLYAAGIDLILALQSLGGWLLAPMLALSFLGNEEFYLLVAPAILWCLDARLGLRAGLLLMLSTGTNATFKLGFRQPRPFWYDPRVLAMSWESSFGAPSGHAQNAMALWGLLALHVRKQQAALKNWATIAAGLLIFGIGLSRLYLGVHFPTDVLAGWIIGALLLWTFLRLEGPVSAWVQRQTLSRQLLAALGGALLLIAVPVAARRLLGAPMPAAWTALAAQAAPEGELFNSQAPFDLSGVISSAGTFFGLAAGALMMQTRGGFSADGSLSQRLVRYPLGLLGVLLLWSGLGAIFPRGELLLPIVLRFIRYALIGLWITLLAPWLFIRLGLAQPERTDAERASQGGAPIRA